MNALELQKEIARLGKQEGVDIDFMDVGITLTVAMSDEQVADLSAMLEYLRAESPLNALGNVLHDLSGLKAVYLKDPHGNCFVPRSAGYAAKVTS